MTQCSVDGCKEPYLAKGFCSTHYYRWRKYGDPLVGGQRVSARTGKICLVDGCESGTWCHGYCMKHYQRWKQHGDPHTTLRPGRCKDECISRSGACLVVGCGKPRQSRGYCRTHYYGLRKHGDPLAVKKIRKNGEGTLSNGYHFTSVKRGEIWIQVGTHRLVMEQKLGRPLRKNENVHHINGDRSDNRPENLELWVKTQPCGQRLTDLVKWATEILDIYGREVDTQ